MYFGWLPVGSVRSLSLISFCSELWSAICDRVAKSNRIPWNGSKFPGTLGFKFRDSRNQITISNGNHWFHLKKCCLFLKIRNKLTCLSKVILWPTKWMLQFYGRLHMPIAIMSSFSIKKKTFEKRAIALECLTQCIINTTSNSSYFHTKLKSLLQFFSLDSVKIMHSKNCQLLFN